MLVWSAIENGGLTIVSFLALVVYSRCLSPSDFGLFSIVIAIVEMVGLFVSMTFHDALVQRPDANERHFDSAFTFTLVLSVFLFLGCVAYGPHFARQVGNPIASPVLILTALTFPCTAVTATIVPWQRRHFQFRPLAIRSLVGRLSGAAIGLVFVALGFHIWALVAQQVLIALVRSLVLWFTADELPRLRFFPREFRSLIRFSLYSISGLFVTFAISRLFTVLVGMRIGTKSAGYLNLGFRTLDMLWGLASTTVLQVALPVLARLQSEPERLRRAYMVALEFICIILYPCFVGIAIVAPEIIEIMFGPSWLAASPYMSELALIILVRAPKQLGPPVLTAVGQPQYTLIANIVELAVMLALIAITGARTLPIAIGIWAARELLPLPLIGYVVRSASGIGYMDQIRGTITPLLASAAMGGAAWVMRSLVPLGPSSWARLFAIVPVCGVTYVVAAWLINRKSIIDVYSFARSTFATRAKPLTSQ